MRARQEGRAPRRAAAAALAAGMAVTLTACSAGAQTGKNGGKPYIAIVSKGFQQQYWQAVKKGAEQEAKKQGAEMSFEGPAEETDVETQVNQLSTNVGKQPDAIGLAAVDSRAVTPYLKQARNQHTPVVAFDSGVDSPIPRTTVATDNEGSGALAAKHMAKAVHGKGKVGMVVHSQTAASGVERRDGFKNWMKKHAPGVKLLPVQYGDGDQTKSADITKAMVAANPDIKGVFGSNEGSALGVIQGVKETNRRDIKTVGFDSGQGQIDALNNGRLTGAITQDPIAVGKQVVRQSLRALKGKKVKKTVNTGYYWYDRKNLKDPKIQEVLYH